MSFNCSRPGKERGRWGEKKKKKRGWRCKKKKSQQGTRVFGASGLFLEVEIYNLQWNRWNQVARKTRAAGVCYACQSPGCGLGVSDWGGWGWMLLWLWPSATACNVSLGIRGFVMGCFFSLHLKRSLAQLYPVCLPAPPKRKAGRCLHVKSHVLPFRPSRKSAVGHFFWLLCRFYTKAVSKHLSKGR